MPKTARFFDLKVDERRHVNSTAAPLLRRSATVAGHPSWTILLLCSLFFRACMFYARHLRFLRYCCTTLTRFGPGRVSYMKPVGQKHVLVEGAGGECLKVRRKPVAGVSTNSTNSGTCFWARQKKTQAPGGCAFNIRLMIP